MYTGPMRDTHRVSNPEGHMKARRPKKKQKQDRMDVVIESEEVDQEPIKDQPQPSWRGISDSHQREGMKMAQMGRGRAQRMITKQS